MTLGKVILDIIELKQSEGLTESDFTFEKAVDWYSWAIPIGLVETEYEGNKLVGYAEWVHLNYIPTNINDIPLEYDTITTAPVLFITNLVAKNWNVLRRLKEKIAERNKGTWEKVCWHSKSQDRFKSFNNNRRGHA